MSKRIKKEDPRSKLIQIRVSSHEEAKIKTNAGARPVSEFLRELGTGKAKNIKTYKIAQQDPALVTEVHKVGVNLNQVARSLNSTAKSGGEINLAVVELHLAAINEQLSEIINRGL